MRSPHDTHHSVDADWPLSLGVDERGRSIHVCADCGAEIPDGALVERDKNDRVVAWTPGGDEGKRNLVHSCAVGRHG